MIKHWQTGESIANAKHRWQDLILEDMIGIPDEEWRKATEEAVGVISRWSGGIKIRVNQLLRYLSPSLERQTCKFRRLPSQALPGATIGDQSLTCSAIAYCLAYDNGYATEPESMARLHLSALTIGWREELPEVYDAVWQDIASQRIEPQQGGGVLEQILTVALSASSKRLSFVGGEWKSIESSSFDDISMIGSAKDFTMHPLNQVDLPNTAKVGLLLGGATKIKGYFMESAKLPEIRGASALLDRINLEDVPALFGKEPRDRARYDAVRKVFEERTGHTISAPECIIYAAGGNTLAFAPTSLVHELADEIERLYTRETLVANSVAVGESFDLLELQYGLKPRCFWLEEFRRARKTDAAVVLTGHYGGTEDKHFLKKKCFGELIWVCFK